MAADEVQDGSLQLVRAIEALHHALDSFGDESTACHHVPLRIPIEMERLTARIMRGQAIPLSTEVAMSPMARSRMLRQRMCGAPRGTRTTQPPD